jgi:RNA polymerase sigma-70 factor (ECF subfamily)
MADVGPLPARLLPAYALAGTLPVEAATSSVDVGLSLETSLAGALHLPRSEFHARWMELDRRRAPDRERVGLAFEHCHGMVFATARRIMGNPWEAEDVVQSVFEALADGLRRVRDPARIPGFLKTCTVRIAMKRTRRSRWRSRRLAEEAPAPAGPVADADTTALVQQLLGRLEPQERAALVLKHVELHSHEEVAELMGVSVGTARRRVDEARRKLVAMLGELDVARIFGPGEPP